MQYIRRSAIDTCWAARQPSRWFVARHTPAPKTAETRLGWRFLSPPSWIDVKPDGVPMRMLPILIGLLCLPLPAGALPLTVEDGRLTFSTPAAAGFVDILSFSLGLPDGAILLEGAPTATDVSVPFRVTVEGGTLYGVSVLAGPNFYYMPPLTGVGTISGAGVDVFQSEHLVRNLQAFYFAGGLTAGTTSDVFFISLPQLEFGDVVGIEIPAGLTGCDQLPRGVSGCGIIASLVTFVVPEPGTLQLLFFGMCLLASSARAARKYAHATER